MIHAGYARCPECGYEFPPNEENNKLSQMASTSGIISGQVEYTDYEVQDVFFCVHEKRYAGPRTPRTMRVDYQVGFNEFKSEWVCPEHTGYARGKFEKWWRERAAVDCPIPKTAQEAVSLASEGLLAAPASITVKSVAGEKFDRITGWRLRERPVYTPPPEPGWNDCEGEDFPYTPNMEAYDDDEIPF